jgi:hypothetical protein
MAFRAYPEDGSHEHSCAKGRCGEHDKKGVKDHAENRKDSDVDPHEHLGHVVHPQKLLLPATYVPPNGQTDFSLHF